MDMRDDILEILVSTEEIQKRTAELGQQIGHDYEGRNPLMICILRGAVVFLSDLIRSVPIHVTVDFMGVSSYGGTNMDSTGVIKITRDVDANVAHRDIIIVEDIVDTGLTMKALVRSAARWTWTSSTAGLRFPTSLSSVTGWITTRTTGTCHSSVS
jgi:hypoxanthine phosphoribosyltransferase